MSNMGHNSVDNTGLLLLIERVERLAIEKADIARDIKDVFIEAKSMGYDVKTMRYVIAQRKLTADARREQAELAETYLAALGML